MDTDNGWEKDIDARGGNLGCKSNLIIPKRSEILECSNVEGDSGTFEKGFLEFWNNRTSEHPNIRKKDFWNFGKKGKRKLEKGILEHSKIPKPKNGKGDSGIPKIPKRKTEKGKNGFANSQLHMICELMVFLLH